MPATPILDRQQAVPSGRTRTGNRLGPLFVLATLLAIPLMQFYVCFLATLIVCVIAHELGHLVAGFVVGFEFRYILAGPFLLAKDARGLRFRFLFRSILGGGRVSMVPKGSGWARHDEIILVAGGPAATALLFLPVALLPWSPLTVCLLLADSLIVLSGWIPMVADGRPNDVRILISLARTSAEEFAAVNKLWALNSLGIEPRDWPLELVERLATMQHRSAYRAFARWCYYIYVRECAESPRIADALELLLAHAADLAADERRGYFTEAAFFQGVFAKNRVLARAWLDDAKKTRDELSQDGWESYPLAAIAIAEGKLELARNCLDQTIKALDQQLGISGATAADRRRLGVLMSSLSQ